MKYLEYSDYTSMGGALPEAAFDRHAFRAQQCIDAMTHGRMRADAQVRPAARYAAFELIGVLEAAERDHGREVASMSNDGVSIAYAVSGASGGVSARCAQIVRGYLACEVDANGTALLYAGVDA